MRTIYPCTKSRHAKMWQRLAKTEGLNLRASWPSWPLNSEDTREPTGAEWCEHSARCLREAAAADVALLYAEPGEQHFGALLECGSALGAGRDVYLVAPHDWPFLRFHPRVTSFPTLREALDTIAKERD
jgi:hypothetical protein